MKALDELMQVVLWTVLLTLSAALAVGQTIQAAHFEWWLIIMYAAVLLIAYGLHIVTKEYKQAKKELK